MNLLYVYRLTSNTGFAPCDQDKLLSLACCKPVIRRVAGRMLTAGKVDSVWLLGIGGKHLKNGEADRWLYAAEFTKAVPFIEYFTNPKYQSRTDCIYRIENPEDYTPGDHSNLRYAHNGKNTHHKEEKWMKRDWGRTDKGQSRECHALLSEHYRWIPAERARELMAEYPSYTWDGPGHKIFEVTEEFLADLFA